MTVGKLSRSPSPYGQSVISAVWRLSTVNKVNVFTALRRNDTSIVIATALARFIVDMLITFLAYWLKNAVSIFPARAFGVYESDKIN